MSSFGIKLQTDSGSGGGVTSINGDATPAQILAVGTAGVDFAVADNGAGTHTFNLPSASTTARGAVTTGAQSIGGTKTFLSTGATDSDVIIKTGAVSQVSELILQDNTGGVQGIFAGQTTVAGAVAHIEADRLQIEDLSGNVRMAFTGVNTFMLQDTSINAALTVLGSSIGVTQLTGAVASVAALAGVAGNVDNGDHDYKITFLLSGAGETDGGAVSNTVTVVNQAADGQINLTGIEVSTNASVIARRIYRRFNGVGDYKLVTQISNNTATTYTDNIANAALTDVLPVVNSTGQLLVEGPTTLGGGQIVNVTEVADANYTVNVQDYFIVYKTFTADRVVNLPASATVGNGTVLIIKNGTANVHNITVTPNGADTIDGGATLVLAAAFDSVTLILSTNDWCIN